MKRCCSRVFCCFSSNASEDGEKPKGQLNVVFHPEEEPPDEEPPGNQDIARRPRYTDIVRESIYVALYDYQARMPGDLNIKTNDRLKLVDDQSDINWWVFEKTRANGRVERGYAPSNYVVPLEDNLRQQRWYAGKIGRQEAIRRLKKQDNKIGAFLVRDSDRFPGDLTLCVLHEDENRRKIILHYRIQFSKDGRCYLTEKDCFQNVDDLIIHHTKYDGGVARKLGKPCEMLETPLPASVTRDKFELSRDAVRLEKKVGNGCYGEVFKGTLGGFEVAIKIMSQQAKMSKKDFIAEADRMKRLQHENIVRLLGVVSDDPIYIVTEYMANGDLLGYLRKGAGSSLEERLSMCAQIASGMAYLEVKNVVHRDLRAANVLVGERGIYKVSDFGLTRFIEDEDYYFASPTSTYPVKWTAVEALINSKFSSKSDVWSFGILLYEIFTDGGRPYPDKDNKDMMEVLLSGYRMRCPRRCPLFISEIMNNCWEEDPHKRSPFKSIAIEFQNESNRANGLDEGYGITNA